MTKINNKKVVLSEADITRKMCGVLRKINEDFETSQNNTSRDSVPIQESDAYFVELKANIQKFVGSIKTDGNSLVVYPSDNDVVFSGEIICMNNLKFQFRYNDQSGGLYIWGDSVLLTKDTTDKLNKLLVLKEQWKTYWDEKLGDYQKNDQ